MTQPRGPDGGGDRDPFAAFNRAQGLGSVRDPYPRWAELRRRAAVHPIGVDEIQGRGDPLAADTGARVFMPVTFDAVSQVLRDGATWSSSGYARTMGLVMGHTILEMDEPEHGRYRDLIQGAFSRAASARWERELVRPAVAEHVDRFRGRGQADLVRELTFPFPVQVIAGMIGLPREQHRTFHRLAVELIRIAMDPARGIAASQELAKLFAPLLAARRERPQEDLISVLAHAELDDTRLSDDEIFAFLRLLAPAGAETTYRSTSNLLLGLLTRPAQLTALRAQPDLLPRAIEEGLRWECPLTSIMRVATCDTFLQGTKIPVGSPIIVNLGAANRDPARWERPDEFDILRPVRPHAAFAFGPHTCLGMHLARMESRVLLTTLLAELPGLRLDPEAADIHVTGRIFRSPLELPVVWDA